MESFYNKSRSRKRRSPVKIGFVIFSTCALSLSSCYASEDAASDALDSLAATNNDVKKNNVEEQRPDLSLLDIVHEAITDASRPLHNQRKRNTKSRWGGRLKSLARLLTSSSAVSHAVTTTTSNNIASSKQSQQRQRDSSSRQRRQHRKRILTDTGDMLDHEMHEGARLLSASFSLVANTFGLLADGVRISGDTAGGFVGSSVRLMGIATKSVSSSFESAGRALEPRTERRKVLTSERLRERQLGKENNNENEYDHGRLVANARSVASQSVRLVGNVVRGIGDVMLLAGEATETIASSTTGVAEDLVRMVEDFAGSVSSSLSPEEREKRQINAKVKIGLMGHHMGGDNGDKQPSFVTYGSHEAPSSADTEGNRQRTGERVEEDSLVDMMEYGVQEFWKAVEFTMAETQGIPSFAGELLGVMLLCFLATFWVVSTVYASIPEEQSHAPARATEITHVVLPTSEDEVSELSDPHDAGTRSLRIGGPRDERKENGTRTSCCSWFVGILLFPFRALRFLLSLIRRALCSKVALLFVLYSCAWMYLCRASQLRSSAIRRNAEAAGYRAALDSLGSSSHSVAESVAWMNALLKQAWRVPYNPDGDDSILGARLSKTFPNFVRRSIRTNTFGKFECRSCEWDGQGPELFSTPACLPYGGLEPYFSGKIGALVLDALGRSRSRRKDVAYASLYSFTLGKTPPLVRSIEFLGVSASDGNNLHFNVDVDAILEDLSLILDVKLSSLEYAFLPSTKISVHAVDVKLPLKVSVSVRPDYPYVSTVQLSLSEAPDCSISITPLSGESGLRGVDVGSLPVIRQWIKDAIRQTLSEYVTPKYISIDVAAWVTSEPSCRPSGIPTHSLADITKLRQRTRALLDADLRTASPRAVAMTSIADTLPSHRSASGTAFVQDGGRLAFDASVSVRQDAKKSLIIKPTTELSKLGMDRFMEKLHKDELGERNEDSVVGMLAKPIAIVAPFVVAIAANMFTQRLSKDE